VSWIVDRLDERWDVALDWRVDRGRHPHEAQHLALDSTKARQRLGWAPAWDLATALDSVVAWYTALRDGGDMREVTLGQIDSFAQAHLGLPA
jgi:CDP-glucose 4,6-dehydratase